MFSIWKYRVRKRSFEMITHHREFMFIVGYNFGTSVSLPLLSISLSLSLSFLVSLLLSPINSPIYHSLSYPPHRLNSLKWKERKRKKERERDEEGMGERNRWGSLWVREGGRLKKRDIYIYREKGEWNRCAKIVYPQWIWTLCDYNIHKNFFYS